MEEEIRKKELIKYVRAAPGLLIGGIIFLVASLALFLMCIMVGDKDSLSEMVVLLVIMFIGGAAMTIAHFVGRAKFDKLLAKIEENNGMQILLNDFEKAGKAFGDLVILGDVFIIGKRTSMIVSYGEITRVYQYIHSTNGVEDTRILKANLAEGRTVDLCRLPLRGKADDELNQVCRYICSKNPNIIVGYRN